MSQEARDARLGLTGLTGAKREARIRLLTERLEREAAAARAALEARRAGAPPEERDGEVPPSPSGHPTA
ncbi:hypothetical protein [Streptomyces hydrogenans]|uniref:hypothetical protein n=1 Tax=Streptomyces hydrogenans TaxID=1873719 RepID=UPI0035E1132F